MKNLILSLGLFLALPAIAADGKPINETRPLNANGRITVSNVAGLIEIKGWSKNEVQITGTLGAGTEKLEILGGGDKLEIDVVLPKRSRDVEGSQLFLRVPEGAQVELQGVSADLSVSGIRGTARLSSVSGNVTVDASMAELRAESVSGDLRIKAPSINTRLSSVSGDVHAEKLSGVLRLETVSGDSTLIGGTFSEIILESVSGNFEFTIDGLTPDGEIEADSVSGDLRLTVPKNLNATVVLETFSGDLRSEFGQPVSKARDLWEATLGNGSGRIHMESHSGDIIVKGR